MHHTQIHQLLVSYMITETALKITHLVLEKAGISHTATTLKVPVLDSDIISLTLTETIPQHIESEFFFSLQTLVRELVAKELGLPIHETPFHIDYRNTLITRIRELETLSKVLASRATAFGTDIHVDPMSALDRKILHTLLQEFPEIHTESEGEGRDRHIVIRSK